MGTITYLDLFLTPRFISTFVRETNKYATNYVKSRANALSSNSRLKDWISVTVAEMKAALVINFNMGLIKNTIIESYWSLKSSQPTS